VSVLRAQDNGVREAKRLDGLWELSTEPDGPTRPVPVPSAYNDVWVEDDLREHVGDVWYHRTIHVPERWADRRVVLRFDAATHRATVFADGEELGSHEGGYTPFEVDLTGRTGAVELTVVVNNELTWASIPPGVIHDLPDGGRRQFVFQDFFNYAGLIRSVWLCATAPTHLADLTVVTALDGTVDWTAEVDGDGEVRATLRDADGGVVAEGDGPLVVADPHLWAPGDGYLYDLQVDVLDGTAPAS
jgi:beta-glucuronidase